MQMFGVGILELLVVLVLTAIVVGPDRMPQVAADLARWIRRARAYGAHLTRDFNEVVSDLEKEAGVSREDWKEIASVVTRQTGDIAKEIEKASSEVEISGDLDLAKAAPPSNVVPFEAGRPGEEPAPAEDAAPESAPDGERPEDKPWFVPETPTSQRRRRRR